MPYNIKKEGCSKAFTQVSHFAQPVLTLVMIKDLQLEMPQAVLTDTGYEDLSSIKKPHGWNWHMMCHFALVVWISA